MTGAYAAIVVILSVIGALDAVDTEIWPIPTECPRVDPLDHTVHLQHESDCTKFYKCDHGERVLFDCPRGLHFNPVLQVCDWPEEANCALGPESTSRPQPPTAPATERPTTPQPEPPNRDPECPWPDPLTYTVHLPHETDCGKFYKCDHGAKVEFDCPDGLHFNKELEVCDWPRDAGCEDIATEAPTRPPTQKPTTAEPEPPNRDPDCPWPDPLNYTVHLPHEDCTKFYKCDHGAKVQFDCPDGLHFNKELEVCDWPRDAGCEEIVSEPPTQPATEETTTVGPEPPNRDPNCPWPDPLNYTVHLPHETDCGKFYKCDHGAKVEFDCPDGLHFNAELEVCDWPSDAGCDDSTVKPPTERPTITTTPKTTTQGTTQPPKDPECPWPDPLNHTVHLPHEDCTKFYKCDNGVKVEFDCPDNLHFNPVLKACDWPWQAGCDTSTEPPTTTAASTTRSTTRSTTTGTTESPKDPDCPWPDPLNDTVHLPHEDCTKFYKCDNGVKVEFDCPDNLHFNPVLEVCDWPWDAGCDPSAKPPTTTTASTTRSTTRSTTTGTTESPRDPDCPWPDPLNDTVHLPHEDCTKFYKCDNGVKVEFDCPDNLHFNPVLEVCDWPWDAGCDPSAEPPTTTTASTTRSTTRSTTTGTTESPRDPDCPWPDPLNDTVHLPHEDCTKFYKCDNGVKVEFDCPDNLHFNPVLEVCDWPWDAGCDPSAEPPTTTTASTTRSTTRSTTTGTTESPRDPDCPWPDPLNDTVHLPHDDCTKFYKCDNGVKVEFDCPDNLHFNPVLEVCDWAWDAGCDPSAAAPTTTTASTTRSTTRSTTTRTRSTTTGTTESPRDPDCPWPDPLNDTVHLPHEDCTKFYKCDNGVKVEFDCPDNLHFNPVLEVCDWPWDAGCDPSAKPPTTTTASTTRSTTRSTTTGTTESPRDPDCPWPDPLNDTVHLPHDDCTKFYKCDNGVKVEFDCPDNLHFNPVLEVCDWPWDAGCDPSAKPPTTTTASTTRSTTRSTTTGTTESPRDPDCPWPDPLNDTVHLPHEDCTKFYKCDNGVKVEFDCPDNLHFNPVLEVCDWPWDAGCDPSAKPPTTTTASTTRSTTRSTTTRTRSTTTGTTESPRDPDCPWPDPLNDTVHLPHEDCTKFYKCDNGVKVEFDCPDNLHFNPVLEVCDWPWDAGCDPSAKPPTTTTASTTRSTTRSTTTRTRSTTTGTTESPRDPDCPWPDPLNDTVHLPHEDCTKFYKCDNGVKVEFDCPDNLHFNPVLEVCDWPWDAGCDPSAEPPTTTTASTTRSTTRSTTTGTTESQRDPDCPWPDPLNDTVHLPHDDCTKFYKCDNGVKVEFDCPDHLHFNPVLEVCDWPWDAGCDPSVKPPTTTTASTTRSTTRSTTTGTTESPRDPDCPWPDPLNDTVHLPHDDCTKFYKCDNGVKVEFDCPDNLHFNPVLEVCDWPWDAGCDPSAEPPTTTTASTTRSTTRSTTTGTTESPRDPDCPWPDPLNDTVHLPHDDCTKFYQCDNGVKVEFDCPDDLHFNPILEVCDWPWDAGCDPSKTTTTTGRPDPCPNVKCQDATIYVPVLSNPRKYIRCVNGAEVVQTCPGSLVFDASLATCNLEHLIEL